MKLAKHSVLGIVFAVVCWCAIGCISQVEPQPKTGTPGMSIEKSSFGKIADGTEIFRYTCTNQHGLKLQVMTYGATVTAMDVPDKDGNLSNVTLGFDSLDGYLSRHPYFGSTVGRFCNRIGAGKFSIDGADYQLATNNGPNHLHGGEKGFDAVVWDAEEIEAADTVGVKFMYRSPDGEEGYPGNVDVTAIYSLNNDNEVTMKFSAMTDKATPINLTNHCYWNLGGAGSGVVLEHDLTIPADWYLPGDANLLPTGEIADVEGTQFDFRATTPIGSRIDQLPGNPDAGDPGGYDNCYCLAAQDGTLQLAARVRDPASGRVIEIHTTQPAIQFYTGNFLDGSEGNGGFGKHDAFCLETQNYPDAPNQPEFPPSILQPGESYQHTTVHKFLTE